ncbi:MAG: extracellular solute-binding protein [Microbacteriaceae bacterium]|nr:extracellular solute-binding protein [Microbacteriaceae bacterium]
MAVKQLRTALVAVLAAGALALAGCSSTPAPAPTDDTAGGYDPTTATSTPADDMEALVAAAQAEGALTLYTDGTLATQQAWAAEFTAKYGIQVSIVRDSGGPLYQKFAQEEAAGQGQADIFGNIDALSLDDAIDNGWLTEYTPEGGPAFPADRSRAGYYYPYLMGSSHSVIYNTNNVTPEELAEVQENPLKALADPKFKGRIGLCPPQLAMLAAAFWYQYTDGDGASDVGWEGLADIAANVAIITDTATLTQNVIQGEVDFAFPVADSLVGNALKADPNTPIAFVYPSPTVGTQFGMGVVTDSPHPAAARLFAEWASSLEGSDGLAELSGNLNLREGGVDGRAYSELDWFTPVDLDTVVNSAVYTQDEAFRDAAGPDGDFLGHWSQVFGYAG